MSGERLMSDEGKCTVALQVGVGTEADEDFGWLLAWNHVKSPLTILANQPLQCGLLAESPQTILGSDPLPLATPLPQLGHITLSFEFCHHRVLLNEFIEPVLHRLSG